MAKLTYSEQLKHPNWQKLRLEKLSAAEWVCQGCYGGDITLHVHHKFYVKGRMAWEYGLDDLVVLCEECHGELHDLQRLLDRVLATPRGYESPHKDALGLIAGYLVASYDLDPDLEKEVRAVTGPMVDVGIAAYVIATSSVDDVAKCLRTILPDGGVNDGPVVRNLLDDWEGRGKDKNSQT